MRLLLPVVQSPRLRQSSIYDYRSCPRKFLLRHRLNLMAKGFSFSRPLEVGTFYHELLASLYRSDSMDVGLERSHAAIEKRVVESEKAAKDPDLVRADYVSALALGRVMATLHWEFYPFDRDRYEIIRLEEVTRNEWGEGIPDIVIRDRSNCDYWQTDHKSEGREGLVRAAPLSFEMQPRLYRDFLQEELGVRMTGSLHNIVVKCPLQFGNEDRPFRTYEHTLKSGKRKGLVETRKEFLSPYPSYDIYLQRVSDWYKAEGEYSILAQKRADHPVILQSWVRFVAGYNDLELGHEVNQMRTAAGHFPSEGDPAKSENWWFLYPRHDESCREYNRLCEFVPLCTSDPETWPEKVDLDYKQRQPDERYAEEQHETEGTPATAGI